MASTLRTFVAVDIDAAVETQVSRLIKRLQNTSAKVKWVDPQHLHYTLKFLGEIHLRDVPEICRAIEKAVRPLESFRAVAAGAGAFPDPERPRTVWLGITDGQEEFVTLHDTVEDALDKLGFRREHRRFRPHLTLGRVRQSPTGIEELGQLVQQHRDFIAGELYVGEVKIFSSVLTKDGPHYTPLGSAELRG
jgi:2'-5' RNA ligase